MSKKLNGLLGAAVMLAMAFGFMAFGPVEVAAQAGPATASGRSARIPTPRRTMP